jgi:hypothetical protein
MTQQMHWLPSTKHMYNEVLHAASTLSNAASTAITAMQLSKPLKPTVFIKCMLAQAEPQLSIP